MFGSDWLKHPAVGVAAFAILALAAIKLNAHYQVAAQNHGENAKQHSEYSVPIGATFRDTPLREERPERKEWREEKDLEAQWIMAVFTAAIAFLTIVGVILLARTLKATRDAVDEARSATQAAIDTAETTREIGQKQVRAYLGGEKAWTKKKGKDGLFLYCNIRNFGQSPARKIEINSCLIYKTIMKKGDWPTRHDPISVIARHPQFITAGGVGTVIIHIEQRIIDKMVGIGASDLRFYCRLTAFWEDVFWDHDDLIIELCQPVGTFNKKHWVGKLVIESHEIQ